jgi:ubiquinone/menaquinone biosynthesis C-methylase UbiE
VKKDPTQRFSTRAENYIKYRPDYPPVILETLKAECRLTPDSLVADIGSGTGKLTRLFLENGNRVYGVEPNREMRETGERLLQGYPRFTSLAGTAEATSLPGQNFDFITVGQALHWFEPEQTRAEFARILKPQGWIVLVWNSRRTGSTPFLRAYEQILLTYATDYEAVGHQKVAADPIELFFKEDKFKLATFENFQYFDFEGIKGRLLSSSYSPEAGHPNHDPMLKKLESLFQQYQVDGQVIFEYDTQLYYGQLYENSSQ